MNTKEILDRIFKDPLTQYELTEFEALGKSIYDIISIYPKVLASGRDEGKTKYYLKSFIPFSSGNEEVQVYVEDGKSAPEEIVRQLWVYKLINQYNYTADEIDLEKSVQFGTEIGSKAADIIVYSDGTKITPKIIIECKKPKRKDGIEQLKSYMNAKGAPVAVWSNGSDSIILYRPYPATFDDTLDPDVTYDRINALFKNACLEWPGIFKVGEDIELAKRHLQVCVGPIEGVRLMGSNLRIMDDAFEYLLPTEAKKKKGQFFTPRHVVEMCVRMLNPTRKEYVMDPSCGSGGFLLHAMDWCYPADDNEKRELRKHQYAGKYLWGIDFEQRAAKTSRALMLIAGDGHTNIFGPDVSSLDPKTWYETGSGQALMHGLRQAKLTVTPIPENETLKDDDKAWDYFDELKFDIILANPPFAGEMKDRKMLVHYELAKPALKRAGDDKQPKEERDVLFIERIIKMLKPGGRASIVLPQLADIAKVHDEVAIACPDYEVAIQQLLNTYSVEIPEDHVPEAIADLLSETFSEQEDLAESLAGKTEVTQLGDVLIGLSGTVGVSSIVREKSVGASINQRILRVKLKNISPEYLTIVLNSIVGKMQFERIGTGGVQTNVSSNDVLKILIPRLDEKIENQITELLSKSYDLKTQSEQLLEQAKTRVEQLIEEAVRA